MRNAVMTLSLTLLLAACGADKSGSTPVEVTKTMAAETVQAECVECTECPENTEKSQPVESVETSGDVSQKGLDRLQRQLDVFDGIYPRPRICGQAYFRGLRGATPPAKR